MDDAEQQALMMAHAENFILSVHQTRHGGFADRQEREIVTVTRFNQLVNFAKGRLDVAVQGDIINNAVVITQPNVAGDEEIPGQQKVPEDPQVGGQEIIPGGNGWARWWRWLVVGGTIVAALGLFFLVIGLSPVCISHVETCKWTNCLPLKLKSLNNIQCPYKNEVPIEIKMCSELDRRAFKICCSEEAMQDAKILKCDWWEADKNHWIKSCTGCKANVELGRDYGVKMYIYNMVKDKWELFNIKKGLKTTHFQRRVKTYISWHGFLSNHKYGPSQTLLEGYKLLPFQKNVLSVEWGHLAQKKNKVGFLCYNSAVASIQLVAKVVNKYIVQLMNEGAVRAEDIEFHAHSLGGHGASMVCKEHPINKIGTLIIFDGAGYKFETVSAANEIKKTDANRVQILHTSMGSTFPLYVNLGISKPSGHIDYYINGAIKQPMCSSLANHFMDSCSHSLSYKFFTESITQAHEKFFIGNKCENPENVSLDCNGTRNVMGICSFYDIQHQGVYYLQTNKQSPYAMGEIAEEFDCLKRF